MTFELHPGKDYTAFGLEGGLLARGARIENPTEGLGQGEQLAFYSPSNEARRGKNEPRRLATTSSGRGYGSGRGSYGMLGVYLAQQQSSPVSLSVVQIEQILGRRLPASARRYRAWWANDRSHSHALSWMDAGWRVHEANLTAERLTFQKSTYATRESSAGIEPRYLKLEDVATYRSTSVSQVYALVRSGEPPAIKLGGRGVWRVDRKKLDDYVDRLEQETHAWTKAHPLNPGERGESDEGALD
jgi:hypothetical protein